MRSSSPLLVLLALGAATSPLRARADDGPWLFSLSGRAALPVTEGTSSLFGAGAAAHLGLSLPVGRHVAFGVRLAGGVLADGAAPADANRVDPGVGSWAGAGLGLTLRPLGDLEPSRRATGLLLSFEAGAAWTGDLVRPALSGALAWGFGVGDVVLQPEVRVEHLVHFDDPLDAGQAVVLSAGLTAVFGDVVPPEVPPDEPPPIGDLDGDGFFDDVDACVAAPEDFDGLLDEDGCPEDDVDGDGITDATDACPTVAEDLDGLLDEDGCPEDDVDGDGFADAADACPEQAEVVNGVADDDGCPDEGLVVLEGDRVVLDETVLFETSRARVRHAAWPVLDAIARLFLTHPEWGTMRVEGHADARGTDDVNARLSTLRAERVRDFLVEHGVPADRVEVAGYGATRPRAEGEGERALAQNRRVEFVMIPAPSGDEGGTP